LGEEKPEEELMGEGYFRKKITSKPFLVHSYYGLRVEKIYGNHRKNKKYFVKMLAF